MRLGLYQRRRDARSLLRRCTQSDSTKSEGGVPGKDVFGVACRVPIGGRRGGEVRGSVKGSFQEREGGAERLLWPLAGRLGQGGVRGKGGLGHLPSLSSKHYRIGCSTVAVLLFGRGREDC
jgi:hypothetical protein